ncbi:stage II sporulation protein P [Litchfieldia salsa]|uniref:Stage II sporulation protein P n=1 Tax=Litchfieldia salsa TaxID=930152 RepID=A0A1H0V8V2_9BACI|nr:stage II sporulation protein P [Litchfieldia salsa]SDP74880.1 stage II sporulation protein P [Litchfieldia salsa]
MKSRTQGMMVTVDGTSISKGVILLIFGIMMTFMLTAIMTSLKPEYRISSSSINNIATTLNGESLVYLLGYENHYFTQSLPESSKEPNYSALVFHAATNINPDDPRSLLGRELPGFSIFDSKLVVAGQGTNYSNLPIESSPPLEVLLEEREASIENIEGDSEEDNQPVTPPEMTTGDKKVVYIYHTHSRESYFPHLKADSSNANNAFHPEVNVTMVGKKLGEELEAKGLGTLVDTSDVTDILLKNKWQYGQSYNASRSVVASAVNNNRDLRYLIDIHRDAARKDVTTATINGKTYARTWFIVGGNNPNAAKNLKVAEDLHHLLEKKYPGLSRGVSEKSGAGTNGKFNQDLSGNAMLIEFGGVDNTMDELNRTAKAVADVLAEYYWEAERVNSSTTEKE